MCRDGKIFPIAEIGKGYLYIGPATVTIELGNARTDELLGYGVNNVVSMLRNDENGYLDLSNEGKSLEELGVTICPA